jgi:phospholipase/carboxylesterase
MLEHELVPARVRESRHLMVVLHGLGDSREGYRWLPKALDVPAMNFLLVDAPDEYYGGFSWYDFAGDPAPGVRRSREMLFELLYAQRAGGFPTEQTQLFGFSQGCLMTLEVGARYPHRLAGLVGVSGYPHAPAQLVQELSRVAREQRFLLTHGTLDPMIRVELVRPAIAQLQAAGLHIEWHEFAKAHTIAERGEVELIRRFVTAAMDRPPTP